MLRTIFVIAIILFGGYWAVQGPFYFLLFYLWYAYFRPDAWIYWLSWVQTLNLSLFLGIGLLITTALSKEKFRFNAAVGLMLLFFVQSIVSTTFSPHPERTWISWWMFVRVWLVSYTIVVLLTDLHRFRLALLVIALSLGLEGAKQGWVGFIRSPGGANTNELPFLGDNNGVAVGMMMLIPIFGALSQTTHRWLERTLYRFLAVGVFVRGVTTYSRGGFLAALVLGIVYLVLSRHKIRTLAGIALVSVFIYSTLPQPFWDRMQTISTPAEERDESARGRFHFWNVAMDMASANPILGVGVDGFQASYDDYDSSQGEFGTFRAVHSTWYGVLADTGYVGFAFFASLFLLTVWNLFRMRRKFSEGGDLRIVAIYSTALITSLAVFATGGSFVNLQYNEMFWHFMGLGTALHIMAQSLAPAAAPAVAASIARSDGFGAAVKTGLQPRRALADESR